MKFAPPKPEELSGYYKSYLNFISEDDLLEALIRQTPVTLNIFNSMPPGAEDFRYAEGKWMVKEVAGHLCDTERILSYRALRFARNDNTTLAGFDENSFMIHSNYRTRSLSNILDEWKSIRSATLTLFQSMTAEMIDRKGIANGETVSPRILLYFILVHERHHVNIVKERYLPVLL